MEDRRLLAFGFVDSGQVLTGIDPNGGNTADVVLDDFDGDGDLDAAVANRNFSSPNQVYINDGTGQFTTSVALPAVPNWGLTEDIEAGDLDGDGDVDLVTSSFRQDWPQVLLNDGNANFTLGDTLSGQRLVARGSDLGDLDGDGDLDILFATSRQIYANDGSGNFIASGTVGAQQGTDFDVNVVDIDGDGDLDAIFSSQRTAGNDVFTNDGSGNFTYSQTLAPSANGATRYQVGLADIDGDGDTDVLNNMSDGRYIDVWTNDGSGSFSLMSTITTQGRNWRIVTGDVDLDGDIDFYAAGENRQGMFLNDGTGTFTEFTNDTQINFDHSAALGDLDGDGDLDLFQGRGSSMDSGNERPDQVWFNGLDPVLDTAGWTFDIDTASTGETEAVYEGLTFVESATGVDFTVTNGELNVPGGHRGRQEARARVNVDELQSGALTVSVDVGADSGPLGENIILHFYGRNVLFHPGYPGGAFRVGGIMGNQNMGFTPARGVLHHLEVSTDGAGNFEATIVDGNNASNVFTTSWSDPGRTSGSIQISTKLTARLDNLVLDTPEQPTNTDPEVAANSATVIVNEGQTATNGGTVTDADGDAVTLDASTGSVINNDGTWSWSLATDDGPVDGTDVTIDADDGNGGMDHVSFTVIVNNVAPDASITGPASALAGDSVSFTLGADDVSSADQAAGFTYNIDWDSDGTIDQTVSGADGLAIDHTFAAGTSTVTITATDKDNGVSAAASTTINVIQPIDVDVKPGNVQNKVNTKSQGVVPVTIYTTADFDATTVNGNSVRLAGIAADHFALEDVDGDGDLDMILHFAVQDLLDALDLDLDNGDEESAVVELTGETDSGIDLLGSDTINFFRPGKGKGKK